MYLAIWEGLPKLHLQSCFSACACEGCTRGFLGKAGGAQAVAHTSRPECLACYADVVEFLNLCQDPTGGFSGGPGQLPHLAPTYAAVLALVTLGGEETLRTVDRTSLQGFLDRMAMPPEQGGGFQVCAGNIPGSKSFTSAPLSGLQPRFPC
jgi:hypothetical protein